MIRPAQGGIGQGFYLGHQAVDIGSSAYFNTPILAPHDGTITHAGQLGSGTNDAGLAVDITGGQFKSRLAHNNTITVKVGQVVKKGQQVGTQGFTGYTLPDNVIGGTHCHWVLWDNGVRVNGLNYINEENEVIAMPTASEVTKQFQTYLNRLPTPTQIAYYTQRGWNVLNDDILVTLKRESDNSTKEIQDSDNWFNRLNKLHEQVLGAPLTRETFMGLIGKDMLQVVEIFSDHPHAPTVQSWQRKGEKASKEKWEQQLTDKRAETITLKAEIEALKNQKNEDTILLDEAGNWFTKLFNRLFKKG